MDQQRKHHWEHVYETKGPGEVSWTQQVPQTSLDLIHFFNLDKSARIIDIGGGDSRLVDFLLEEHFEHITVLDISEKALERAKQRLGKKADRVTWIEADITSFEPATHFDVWHDRATFHFLTTEPQVSTYISIAQKCIEPGGYAVVGTFSNNGPDKCSGLPVKQYSEESLTAELAKGFLKIKCITEDHVTPFNTKQNFLFCSFKRR